MTTRAPAGSVTVPAPNGQMPAIARNSVVLPDPVGPVTSTASAAGKAMSCALTSGAPVGRLTSRSSISTALASLRRATETTGGVRAAARAAAIAASNPARRSITARHSASWR